MNVRIKNQKNERVVGKLVLLKRTESRRQKDCMFPSDPCREEARAWRD